MTESTALASSPWVDLWQRSMLALNILQIWQQDGSTNRSRVSPYVPKPSRSNKKNEDAFDIERLIGLQVEDGDRASQLSRKWFVSNGGSTKFSLFTRQGRKQKINQDAMIAWEQFAQETFFCGVFDGHGRHGHLVAHSVRETLPHLLARLWRNQQAVVADKDICDSSDDAHIDSAGAYRSGDHIFAWKDSFLNAYRRMDEELLAEDFDSHESGTTAVTLVRQGSDLIIANVGDSRAVLGMKADDGSILALQLTVDLTPKEPREAERIRRNNGEVFSSSLEPSQPRVWLPKPNSPGLAMSRALGDYCFKNHGVISEPEVTYRHISNRDEFVVLATDGVWNVLTNEEVVETVVSTFDKSSAAKAVVRRAERAWKAKHAGYRMDDCTVVCLFLR